MTPFFIPVNTAVSEQVVKQSRFICHVGHASTMVSAEEQISAVRKNHPQASHTCWACIAGPPDSSLKGMSDDGEPKGTAGRPMLSVLEYSGIGEVWATVTRYFGGIKLGTGGLVRAYGSSVQNTLQTIETTQKQEHRRYRLAIDYRSIRGIEKMLADCTSEIIARQFGKEVDMIVLVPLDQLERLQNRLLNLSSGRFCLDEQ